MDKSIKLNFLLDYLDRLIKLETNGYDVKTSIVNAMFRIEELLE